jgi:hypothetical protein
VYSLCKSESSVAHDTAQGDASLLARLSRLSSVADVEPMAY